MIDVNATSGIQTQAYATSVLATLRKGLTKLETAGYAAGAIVLHPTDWEGVELALSSTNAIEHLSLPYDPASRRLFGVPVVETMSEAAGVGHVLAVDAVVVNTDTIDVGVQGRSPPTPTTSPRTSSAPGARDGSAPASSAHWVW